MPGMTRRRVMRRRPRRIPRSRFAFKRVRRAQTQIHHFKRTFRVTDLIASYNATTGITTPISAGISVNLAQLPGSSEFTTLYDQYKIKGAAFKIQPLLTEGIASVLSGSTNVWGFPKLSTVIDFDDVANPATEDVMLQYGSLKQTGAFKEHKRFFKPKVRLASLDTGGAIAATTPNANMWLDVANPSVPHYGLKIYHPGPIASGTPLVSSSISYSVYCTLYFCCKNTR